MTQDETVRRLCSMASLSGEMAGIAIGLAACQDKEALEAVRAELRLVGRDFGESLSKVGAAARSSFAAEGVASGTDGGWVRLPVDDEGRPWRVGDAYRLRRDAEADAPDHVSWLAWDGEGWEVDGEPVAGVVRWDGPERTPSERILAWVDAFDESDPDFGPLVELAHEMEGGAR